MKHCTENIFIRGRTVEVDSEIVHLIVLLNSIPGVFTLNSCQGPSSSKDKHHLDAYVQMDHRASLIIPYLSLEIKREQRKWEDSLNTSKNRRAIKAMTVRIEVDGNGICIRWMPWDYKRVFDMVKRIAALLS